MIPAIADHLWQSTAFAAVASLLALAFRNSRAGVRFWIWLAASAKFLVPFAALVVLGTQFSWRPPTPVITGVPASLTERVSQPFAHEAFDQIAAAAVGWGEPAAWLPLVLVVFWAAGATVIALVWLARWRRISAGLRHAVPIDRGRVVDLVRRVSGPSLPVIESDSSLEPGVFGILRPVLLWPRGISERLTDAQIEAIVAHELAHARRRDNLLSAVHMLAQALFWFHPVVWWIGSRLVDERERACDEDVIGRGSDRRAYAEGILKTSRFCVESPMACVAGVTGANLATRIEAIMTARLSAGLDVRWRIVLLVAATSVIALPVVMGAVDPRSGQTWTLSPEATFDVASIRPWRLTDNNSREARLLAGGADPYNESFTPTGTGRYVATAITLRRLAATAYGLRPNRITGGPDWIDRERYSIEAKADDGALLPGEMRARVEQLRIMLQNLLADRFGLRIHREVKPFDVYALTVAKSGLKLQQTDRDCSGLAVEPGACHSWGGGAGRGLIARGVDMNDLAGALTLFTDRPVVDATGVGGLYDIQTNPWNPYWAGVPDGAKRTSTEGPAPVEFATLPTVFTLVQEELGLRLQPSNAPLEIVVIDGVQKPTQD